FPDAVGLHRAKECLRAWQVSLTRNNLPLYCNSNTAVFTKCAGEPFFEVKNILGKAQVGDFSGWVYII
ncbi:MAG TPA: hypothetical protein VIK64_00320, partial [Anaerolineales bacterium]